MNSTVKTEWELKKFTEQKIQIARYKQYTEDDSFFKGSEWPSELKTLYLESIERADNCKNIKERDVYMNVAVEILKEITTISFITKNACPKCGKGSSSKYKGSGLFLTNEELGELIKERSDGNLFTSADFFEWLMAHCTPYIRCEHCNHLKPKE